MNKFLKRHKIFFSAFIAFHAVYLIHGFTILSLFLHQNEFSTEASELSFNTHETLQFELARKSNTNACSLFAKKCKLKALQISLGSSFVAESDESGKSFQVPAVLSRNSFLTIFSLGDDAYKRYLNLRVLLI